MAPGSALLIRSGEAKIRSGDQYYPYRQNSNFFYLTGMNQKDNLLAVNPDHPDRYTVVKGDYLSKIAKRVYGDAMKYNIIFDANRPMLSDPNKIYPGQVLVIPPLDE